jgi:hypothetical protein
MVLFGLEFPSKAQINTNLGVNSSIAAGSNNIIQVGVQRSFIGAGDGNTNAANNSIVGAGYNNGVFSAPRSGIVAGSTNKILTGAANCFIGAGSLNLIEAGSTNSFIGAGYSNQISEAAPLSFIGAGKYNRIGKNGGPLGYSGDSSFIGAGYSNAISASVVNSGIVSGSLNQVYNPNSVYTNSNNFIGGGYSNVISNVSFSTIVGGRKNWIDENRSFIGGGESNIVSGSNSVIGGGRGNLVNYRSDHSAILGGFDNTIQSFRSYGTIGGGWSNVIGGGSTAQGQVVAGGAQNNNLHAYGVIGGGYGNNLYLGDSNNYSVIAGGLNNQIGHESGAIGGGEGNSVAGRWGVIPGGYLSRAYGQLSFAAGYRAYATNAGSFVWNGSTQITASTNDFSFTVRCLGGARFITSTYTNGFPGVTNGVILAAGGSSWASLSDRNSKTNFHPIQPRVVLAKLADMPVSMWEYKGSPGRAYIGPTAQDFHQAFGLGQDDKSISTLDTDGVMYAAIQGLVEELKERDQMMALQRLENASALVQRDGEIESLKKDIRELKDRIDSMLPPSTVKK